MSKSRSEKARAKLYRSAPFRHELADGLGFAGIKVDVTACLDALLEARRLPSSCKDNVRAAAMDAAMIVIALGSMQTNRDAMLHTADRLGAMTLTTLVDTSGGAEREVPFNPKTDLMTDLSKVFEDYWAAPDGAFIEGLCHTTFFTTIAEIPSDDSGMLVHISANKRQAYSAATLPTVDLGAALRRKARGGMMIMPSSLANFAEQLRHDLDGTPAAFRDARSTVGIVEPPRLSKDGKIVTSAEFSRILSTREAGNEILTGLDERTALSLRFELRGYAAVDGIGYCRDGGPSEDHKRFAEQVVEIGVSAAETAERFPKGGVVVDTMGRPWCRIKTGICEYRHGGIPFVFDSEGESSRFAERTNAKTKGDPDKSVRSMSTRDFATEAVRHADMWRNLRNEGM